MVFSGIRKLEEYQLSQGHHNRFLAEKTATATAFYFSKFRQESVFTSLTSRGGHVINLDVRFTSRPRRWRADLNPASSEVSLFGLLNSDSNSDVIVSLDGADLLVLFCTGLYLWEGTIILLSKP